MISSAVVALFDLVQSEADLLRRKAVDGAVIVLLLVGAALAAFAGLGLLGYALYDYLQLLLPRPWPEVAVAGVCFLCGGILVWLAIRMKR